MQGSSTTSVSVKYRPSANTRSRGGNSVVFTFLISEFPLVEGTEPTDSLARAALSSRGDCSESGIFSLCLCSFSFCLRILSSLWTLTGSPSLRSSVRMDGGGCVCRLVEVFRCASTAEGISISQSLVHLLTCAGGGGTTTLKRLFFFKKIEGYI